MRTVLALTILPLVLWCTAIYLIATGVHEKQTEMESNIGKSVILKSDTLQVVDYSIWNGSYTLSNGVVTNKIYFSTLKQVK
jgi:hypothetical protein